MLSTPIYKSKASIGLKIDDINLNPPIPASMIVIGSRINVRIRKYLSVKFKWVYVIIDLIIKLNGTSLSW